MSTFQIVILGSVLFLLGYICGVFWGFALIDRTNFGGETGAGKRRDHLRDAHAVRPSRRSM